MVHGWPDTLRRRDAQGSEQKKSYRCIRFTFPGFDPSHVRRARALGELIDFLRAIVERHGVGGRAILMLHDWGCILGYQFAMRHPQMVSRIVGVDIGDPKSLRRAMGAKAISLSLAYQVWLALSWKLGGSIGDWMTRAMARWGGCPSDPAPMGSQMNYLYYQMWFGPRAAFRDEIRRFQPACPMLYIYGRRKHFMFHADAWLEELRARPGNRVEAFDTGHWVMTQQPARFNQVVGEWLAAQRGK